ncbi:MAG: arylamine N-acetyltransferase [Acidimicrobiia bacterium]|nr:arylamine N-acetyltransferase [Acidimicrobiia bacterium]MDH5289937.1 arylamine N-acetyltransferase [Acidimicrobiia bacterium]
MEVSDVVRTAAAGVHVDIDRYLARIGYDGPLGVNRDTLEALQRAHMTAVPFENVDVYAGVPVRTGTDWSLPKVVDRGRGGWCFELNGAFGALLGAIGFRVLYLAAAVVLRGPTDVVDHLTLEVLLDDGPYLVDVGFGDGPGRPLALNRSGLQDGLVANFELVRGAQAITLVRHEGATPAPQYRFRRVAVTLDALEPASQRLQADHTMIWHARAFASRLVDGGPGRISLLGRTLRRTAPDGSVADTPVADRAWADVLKAHFGIRVELDEPPERGNTIVR